MPNSFAPEHQYAPAPSYNARPVWYAPEQAIGHNPNLGMDLMPGFLQPPAPETTHQALIVNVPQAGHTGYYYDAETSSLHSLINPGGYGDGLVYYHGGGQPAMPQNALYQEPLHPSIPQYPAYQGQLNYEFADYVPHQEPQNSLIPEMPYHEPHYPWLSDNALYQQHARFQEHQYTSFPEYDAASHDANSMQAYAQQQAQSTAVRQRMSLNGRGPARYSQKKDLPALTTTVPLHNLPMGGELHDPRVPVFEQILPGSSRHAEPEAVEFFVSKVPLRDDLLRTPERTQKLQRDLYKYVNAMVHRGTISKNILFAAMPYFKMPKVSAALTSADSAHLSDSALNRNRRLIAFLAVMQSHKMYVDDSYKNRDWAIVGNQAEEYLHPSDPMQRTNWWEKIKCGADANNQNVLDHRINILERGMLLALTHDTNTTHESFEKVEAEYRAAKNRRGLPSNGSACA